MRRTRTLTHSGDLRAPPRSFHRAHALVGERAGLEGGGRTATLVAVTPCRVAVADPALIDRESAVVLQAGHRREVTG